MVKVNEEKLNLFYDLRKSLNTSEQNAYKYMASTENKYGVSPLDLLETVDGRLAFIVLINEQLNERK
ncbi:MAG: hypothetical protein GYB34_07935 [Gammaproteobacteria bacterium]|nr:hypothetical protein [Gammaproteobacteria bacterium]